MDRKLLMATAPQMSNYNNWPSKESVQKNRDLYYRQKEQIRRLSPSTTFYRESSRFGNSMKRRNTSFYKNHDQKEFNEMVHDPVSLAVEDHRAKMRATSTLKATKNMGLMKQPVFFLNKNADVKGHARTKT